MNIPSKVAKSNYLVVDKVTEHQNVASKYFKQYTRLRKGSTSSETKKTNHHLKGTKNLKEEIISWFFSLDILTKLIISSIENKWVTNLLHQLYIHQKYNPTLKFQIKEGDLICSTSYNPQTEYTAQLLKVSLNDINSGSGALNCLLPADGFSYLQYFSNREDYGSHFIRNEDYKIGDLFLSELKFYKSEDLILNFDNEKIGKYSNYFTLSEKLIEDEKLFRFYFDKFSNYKAFTSLVPSSYDASSKHHSIYLPEWIKSKELYSAAEIFAAFFEQVITVKYILHKQASSTAKLTSHLENAVKEKNDLVSYLQKNENNWAQIFETIKEKKIVHEIYDSEYIRKFNFSKIYQGDAKIYYTFTNFSFDGDIFDKENLKPEEIESQLKKLLDSYEDDSKEKFIDKLFFLNIDKIFSYDDFLFRKIFELLSELRQRESFNDLMNENFSNTSKFKKKKKKKSNINQNRITSEVAEIPRKIIENTNLQIEKAQDKKYAFSFIKSKNSCKKEDPENFIYKDFLGNLLLIKKQNSDEDLLIEQTVKNLMEEILTTVTFNHTFKCDLEQNNSNIENKLVITSNKTDFIIPKEKEIKINEVENITLGCAISNVNENILSPTLSEKNDPNDTDTAYSSEGNMSYNNGKKRNKNKFFLYDVNKVSKKIKLETKNKFPENKNNYNSNPNCPNDNIANGIQNNLKSINENKNPVLKVSKQINFNSNCSKLFKNEENNSKENINPQKENGISPVTTSVHKLSLDSNLNLNPISRKEVDKNSLFLNDKNFGTNKTNIESGNNFQIKRKYSNGNYNKYSKVTVNVNVYNNNNINNFNNINYNYNPSFNYNANNYPPPTGVIFGIPNQIPNMCNNSMNIPLPMPGFFPTSDVFKGNQIAIEFFQFKLHKDILDFCLTTETNLRTMKPFKALVINYLDLKVGEFLNETYGIKSKLEVYGSFASEMDIESSDIDITIKLDESETCFDTNSIMKSLSEDLSSLSVFEVVNPIFTASVPVLKLQLDPWNVLDESNKEKYQSLKESEIFTKYKFERSEMEKIKIDLTFFESIKKKNKNINVSLKHTEMIKNYCIIFPEIKPLIKVLKRFLQVNNLNNTFNGGLSSFSLFLLLLAVTKVHRNNFANNVVNLGKLFIEFLMYYGSFLDFNDTVVDVNLDNPFIICPDSLENVPTILDPITYNNVGKSSYKISSIKGVFNFGSEHLNELRSLLEKNYIDSGENLVYLLLLKGNNINVDNVTIKRSNETNSN